MRSSNALMIVGTGSDVGKTTLVVGICRYLNNLGVKVAPFKGQNMALNSFVTSAGHEIARAQELQANAARVESTNLMNPILLKPTGDTKSQVIVLGEPSEELTAKEFYSKKHEYKKVVDSALEELRSSYDFVLLEGAGSPAEINLKEVDLVNLGLCKDHSIPAVLVGDIEKGGVFASIYGTYNLLDQDERKHLNGFIINKFRGDKTLLGNGPDEIARMCETKYFGCINYFDRSGFDFEDSMSLSKLTESFHHCSNTSNHDVLDIAILKLDHISNFNDFDPLRAEPGVRLRLVGDLRDLNDPDLIIIPGTKSTVEDLRKLESMNVGEHLSQALENQASILGICGGFQMLCDEIVDNVESKTGTSKGLGLLDARCEFEKKKTLRQVRAKLAGSEDIEVFGYEIHYGKVKCGIPLFELSLENPYFCQSIRSDASMSIDRLSASTYFEGGVDESKGIYGTAIHGVFENDSFRSEFLRKVAARRKKEITPSNISYLLLKDAWIDYVTETISKSINIEEMLGNLS